MLLITTENFWNIISDEFFPKVCKGQYRNIKEDSQNLFYQMLETPTQLLKISLDYNFDFNHNYYFFGLNIKNMDNDVITSFPLDNNSLGDFLYNKFHKQLAYDEEIKFKEDNEMEENAHKYIWIDSNMGTPDDVMKCCDNFDNIIFAVLFAPVNKGCIDKEESAYKISSWVSKKVNSRGGYWMGINDGDIVVKWMAVDKACFQ